MIECNTHRVVWFINAGKVVLRRTRLRVDVEVARVLDLHGDDSAVNHHVSLKVLHPGSRQNVLDAKHGTVAVGVLIPEARLQVRAAAVAET